MGECSQEGEEQESLLSLSAQRVGQLGDQGGAWPSAFPHAELAWEPTHQPGSHQPVCFLQTQTVQHNKEMTLASNRSLAEGNLLYQPQLDAQKARLTQKYQELQVLFEAYQIKKTKLDKQSNSASLETLLALLQAEGAKIEEDTEVRLDSSVVSKMSGLLSHCSVLVLQDMGPHNSTAPWCYCQDTWVWMQVGTLAPG